MKRIKLQWNIFMYFAIFTAIIIGLLWLFQIVFLDDFYRAIKENHIKASANSIAKNIDNVNLVNIISEISENSEIEVEIRDSNFNRIIISNNYRSRPMRMDIGIIYQAAKNKGGEYIEKFSRSNIRNMPMNNISIFKIVKNSNNEEMIIILNAMISPVNATVKTLKVQLIYITLIMVLLALLIAFFISKKISKPIININECAKILATGNYEVSFNGDGYKEIEELSATLNYATAELSKVEKLRRELIANISHDLRTPLTMITGYSEVMRDLPNENTKENLQIVIDEAKRLTSLVNDVLDISKLQTGNLQLNLENFNITCNISQMIKRYNKLLESEGYSIVFEFEDQVFVNGDEIRILQVLSNLINNAITYSGDDKKIVVTQIINDDSVKIEIIDFGEGIEPESVPYIWDRYYKVDKIHKRATVGTGLGLSIVKSILDMHNGAKYGVQSNPGSGSIFWFSLVI